MTGTELEYLKSTAANNESDSEWLPDQKKGRNSKVKKSRALANGHYYMDYIIDGISTVNRNLKLN